MFSEIKLSKGGVEGPMWCTVTKPNHQRKLIKSNQAPLGVVMHLSHYGDYQPWKAPSVIVKTLCSLFRVTQL